jgi:hypothetical protein
VVNHVNQQNRALFPEFQSFDSFSRSQLPDGFPEIYAPGQLDALRNGGVSNSRSINIQPGAITVNEAARPGQTAEELEEAFIRLLESQQ